MDERTLVKAWIDAMPDDTGRADYRDACVTAALAFLHQLRAAAQKRQVSWQRFSYWRSMVSYFIGE